MSPRSVSDPLVRDTPVLAAADTVETAVRRLLDTDLPALPVAHDRRYCGIFGEREFLQALFPGYLNELGSAGFVTKSLDSALDKRSSCRRDAVREYMNTEHVDVGADFSDAQVAEIFLHHRVLVLPVIGDDGRVAGVITRSDFFRAVARRFVGD
ncbi:MAG TPA: CBS domain-containing protein [Solirubrobacteraceae bacterium]|jgi:CBS domain-containing protein|nr:CBS domain-containing protein [Solirubrobacteraceae bacterium]